MGFGGTGSMKGLKKTIHGTALKCFCYHIYWEKDIIYFFS